ncbi:RbcX protein [Xenococcus sp. PCC 7305]|uniref:chaperonin family protein RbcX n=1 Tax=Xenococcus sp. PCC 7305 TaxID=102125 RepID=UPI0002AC492B|nr:chaperonin family protein RbcX [Xenococcus sp. PCC 7305]ELS04741.1 RbcX protein [Xenococcus sp. PCC 7305]
MNSKKIAQDTAKVLQDYLTYQAVKVIVAQLTETNPGEAIWLRQYSSDGKLQDGEAYIEGLMSEIEGKKLVIRILTVRDDLAEQVLEYLPEMVSTSIKQANLAHRRHLLERLTQSSPEADIAEPGVDANEYSDENK